MIKIHCGEVRWGCNGGMLVELDGSGGGGSGEMKLVLELMPL